jgi:hypothetical protein
MVVEEGISDYITTYDINPATETREKQIIITNKKAKYQETAISGLKIWDDYGNAHDSRPDDITIKLLQDGKPMLDENGQEKPLIMGCYGIGVTRVVAAAIEQNFDDRGIIWTDSIAPFQVVIIPMNMHKSERVQELAERFYNELQAAGVEVLLDDRKERPGVMFADMELIGVPHSIVIGDRGIDNGVVEYKYRRSGDKTEVAIDEIIAKIKAQLTK